MTRPLNEIVCVVCGATAQSRTGKTCSRRCRALMRQAYSPTGSKPRTYDPDLIQKVREMYEAGHTIAETQAQVQGCKVQLLMDRAGIARRKPAKREQRGSNNSSWRGNDAGYQALHLRVESKRGKPSECSQCGTTDPGLRYEWANLTGNYQDPDDYARMCVSCHRAYDAARRALTGQRTSPPRKAVMPNV